MNAKATSNIDVRRANRNRIYRLIASGGAVSKPEIAQRLGLSLPTVMQNVNSLQEDGLIREDGSRDSTGGRKAVAYARDALARAAVGVEITRDGVTAALVGLDGDIVAGARRAEPFALSAAYADELAGVIEELIGGAGIPGERVLGVGISIPGILTSEGRVLNSDVLDLWDFDTGALVRDLPYPAVFCNDANAAAVAELWLAEPGDNFAYLALSDSVGGAIVWNGELFEGDNVRSGEFGHITLERGGADCYCGRKGCLDCYCSAQVLSGHAEGGLGKFFTLLEQGGVEAASAWARYLDYLATGVNILNTSLDCDIVIGGYVGTYIEPYIGDLRKKVAEQSTFDAECEFVKPCRRRTDAHSVGAALVHIRKFVGQV